MVAFRPIVARSDPPKRSPKKKAKKRLPSRSGANGRSRGPIVSDVQRNILRTRGAQKELEARVRELESELSDMHYELERSERRVEAMKQIGRALGSNLELDPLLSEIVSRTTDLLEADRSTLFLVDADKRELWSKIIQGEELKEIRLPFGQGLAGWVADHGKPLHIRNAYKDKRFNPAFDKESGYKTRCMLVWPVRHPQSTEVLGVVQVLNKKEGNFNATDERLLEAIASEIGVALEVATLYRQAVEHSEALEKTQSELQLLFETERVISQSSALEDMLGAILDTAMTALRAKTAAIHVIDERGLRIEVIAAHGVYARSLEKTALQIGEGVVGNIVRTGEPVCLNDLEGMRRGRINARSVLAVPIRTKYSGIIGSFELINRRDKKHFSQSDVATLTVVAAQAGRAIAAERRRKEREQSERLTTIGRMLSGVMHDMRTPMTLISGYTQIMASSENVDDRSQYAHLVNRQIDLLSAMTKDLLAFARGERNVLIRKVYVHRFMDEMRDYLEQEFAGSGVTLVLDTRYRGAARFDETKMRRVFHNIARNAREAMPGGGTFRIRVLQDDEYLVIHFTDTGSGIPSELEDRVFEPFATSGKVGGTGLGLAMVRQIAEEHRGTVNYESTRRGTRFTFRLPLEP
jgi:signal transduction histidine kinase